VSSLSPVVNYHWLAHRYPIPPRLLVRPQPNGGTLAKLAMTIDIIDAAQLREPIVWRLPVDGANEVPLAPLPGWAIVTPIGCARMGHAVEQVAQLANEALVMHHSPILRYRGERLSEDFPVATIAQALSLVRCVSKQFTIPRHLFSLGTIDSAAYATGPAFLESANASGNVILWDHALQGAVTENHLVRLAGLSPDFTVPVHVEVLLDALEAHRDQDFRKALLYAAIAVESLAAAVLEVRYTQALHTPTLRHRIATMPIAGGGFVHKDPVYEALSTGDNFSRLLHERPLYLSNESLLLEEPETFRLALQLYTTRNKIAHRGQPPQDAKYFAITREGSRDGLAVALEVFRWFGDPGPYCIPANMVAAADGKPVFTG
jgi:hypothetical protein